MFVCPSLHRRAGSLSHATNRNERTLYKDVDDGPGSPARRPARRRDIVPARRMLWRLCLVLFLLLLPIGCASSKPGDSAAGSVQVRLGPNATEASSPDLTLEALRAGQSVYRIEADRGAIYRVELTEDQITDLVAGSTVMTEATGDTGNEPVRISVQKASKKSFLGW